MSLDPRCGIVASVPHDEPEWRDVETLELPTSENSFCTRPLDLLMLGVLATHDFEPGDVSIRQRP